MSAMVTDDKRDAWFRDCVLPLEASLTRFLNRHWNSREEVADLRHDIYERALQGAQVELPLNTAAYVFAIARNHMINRAKRARVIAIDLVANLEELPAQSDILTPERYASARQELLRVQSGLDHLPPRCREIVWLRKVEGLSTREVANRLGVGIDAIEQQTSLGMRALADFMLGGSGAISRRVRLRAKQHKATT